MDKRPIRPIKGVSMTGNSTEHNNSDYVPTEEDFTREEPPRKVRWFRKFVGISQGFFAILVIFVMLPPYLYIFLYSPEEKKVIEHLFEAQRRAASGGDVYYEIGGSRYSKGYLNRIYDTLQNQGVFSTDPKSQDKQFYLRESLNIDILVNQALKENVLNDPAAIHLLTLSTRKTLADYYFQKVLRQSGAKIKTSVSDAEVMDFYLKNAKAYSDKKVDKDTALKSIRFTLNEMLRNNVNQELQNQRNLMIQRLRNTSKVNISSNADFGY